MSVMKALAIELDIIIGDRSEVRVARDHGWVTHKATDTLVGMVWHDRPNVFGEDIWRAYSGSVGDWTSTRTAAIFKVIDLWNMQQKARAYDRMTGMEGASK